MKKNGWKTDTMENVKCYFQIYNSFSRRNIRIYTHEIHLNRTKKILNRTELAAFIENFYIRSIIYTETEYC